MNKLTTWAPMALYVLSAALAMVIILISICRLNIMSHATRKTIRGAYAFLMSAAAACIILPLAWSAPVTVAQVGMQAAIVWRLVADVRKVYT